MKKITDIQVLKDFINAQSPETKVYIGTDSFRRRIGVDKKTGEILHNARYTTVVVVHIDGCHGCSLWGRIEEVRDYEKNASKPVMRMMNEVIRTAQMYLEIADVLVDREIEIHMDINPNKIHGSSVALDEAKGYIQAMCNVVPMAKPDAFAASFGADRFREYGKNTPKHKGKHHGVHELKGKGARIKRRAS